MVTAWSLPRLARARFDAGPLPRVLALAVLLFGVLMAHGVHVESVGGHLSASAMTPGVLSDDDSRRAATEPARLIAAEADGHPGGHEPAQPAEQCAAGQPQQGPALVPPCFAVSVREASSVDDAATVGVAAAGRPVSGDSSAALRAASVVRQV